MARLVDSNGNAHIETDLERTLVLQQPVWDDLRVNLSTAKVAGASVPDFSQVLDNGSGSTGVFAWLFDKTTEQEIFFAAQMPHGQLLNTPLSPHVHWLPVANGSADAVVNWGLEYTWSNIGGVFGNTTIAYANSHIPADASLVANKMYISPFTDIEPAAAGAGDSVSSVLICRLFRDAAGNGGTDDYDDDAAALYMDFHIQLDTMGSRTELTK